MSFRKRFCAVAAVALLTAAVFYGGTQEIRPLREENQVSSFFGGFGEKETIYFWYTEEAMTSFVNSAAVSFGERESVRVIPVLTSEGEYLEAINEASLYGTQMPDVYLLSHDSLEKAYLAGLAGEIEDRNEVCNAENFPQVALDAVSYHGKRVAYPLFFETSALLYNETYLTEWAAQQETEGADLSTVDVLLYVADTFDAPESMESIMNWDVSDIFYNYWVVGNYMVVGGDCGDDENILDIANEETIKCLEVYRGLNQFFSMDSNTVSYDALMEDFLRGKTFFTIVTTDAAARLEEAKREGSFVYDYGVAMMPDISEELKSRSLSVTGTVVVNGYSEHRALADRFAAYLTTECAEDLYARTGKAAAYTKGDMENHVIQIFKQEYQKSVPLPKMMGSGNYWLQLEVIFSKVWNGADAEPLVEALAEQMRLQLAQQKTNYPE